MFRIEFSIFLFFFLNQFLSCQFSVFSFVKEILPITVFLFFFCLLTGPKQLDAEQSVPELPLHRKQT
jgi:hypothetical protein